MPGLIATSNAKGGPAATTTRAPEVAAAGIGPNCPPRPLVRSLLRAAQRPLPADASLVPPDPLIPSSLQDSLEVSSCLPLFHIPKMMTGTTRQTEKNLLF